MSATAAPITQRDLQAAIVPRLSELSPALRRAADFVLSNPDTVAMESLRQIAKEHELTPATFSRLARSLDLEGYEALRDLCRDEIRQRTRSFADKAGTLQEATVRGQGEFLKQHAAASIGNIDDMLASIDGVQLARVADDLSRARTVLLVGALSSASVVDYLAYSARMALSNWRAALRNDSSMAMDLTEIGERDSIVILSHEPYARLAIEMASMARENGANIIAVTDSFSAPITPMADEIFVVPTQSPHFFASEVATVLLLEALLSMVVQRTGKKAQRRIADVEQQNHRSGDYWQS